MAATHSTIRPVPKLLLVTDRRATAGRALVDVVAHALDAGLPAVQLREKDLPGRELFALATRLRDATRRTGALLFVNDRVDVARAVDADGVQLGASTLPVAAARALLPTGRLIGESTHAADEVASSAADFAIFGPIYDTPTKRAFGAPQGESRLREAIAVARVPLVAIGGIDAANVARLRDAGAHGVAIIRAILAASDAAAVTRTILDALR
jgi:thiamine-phosphate pyrophosphorylase